ncbi:MAG: NrpR regulatory domain-containing protein [Dehalococcoidia bacterium]
MSFETLDVERKVISIMKVLSDSDRPVGARVIAQHLKDYGVELGDRAVRYHLKLMDERGLTRLVGRRDGRVLTEQGIKELKSALVKDKVGFVISKIELLAFRTDFDFKKRCGAIPVNVTLFPKEEFSKALQAMRPAFETGLCASDLVAMAPEGERLGELTVPYGKIGMATVCSIIINGTLLKAGVPMDSRFGGILQIRNHKPLRFVELISYAGSSLDPSEMFIRAKMTSVREAAELGDGEILANFREIPALCRPTAEQVVKGLKQAGLGGLIVMGNTSEPVCEVPVDLNRVGMILLGGLNPVAAAEEAGINTENHAMQTVMEYQDLIKFQDLLNRELVKATTNPMKEVPENESATTKRK